MGALGEPHAVGPWAGTSGAASRNRLTLTRVGSTNALARRIVGLWGRETPFPGLTIVAAEQTDGRGRRRGRGWVSPPGRGVYLTVVRALERRPPDGLSLLAGAAVCDVLRRHLGLPAGLEWPNDVLVAGRKICGVLVEVVGAGGAAPVAIIGIGLNVTHRREELPREDATSIALETGRRPEPATLVPDLVAALDRELERGRAPGYAVRRFEELTVHRAGELLVCSDGDRTVQGRFEGLEPSGALRLRVGGELRVVHGGELRGGVGDAPC